MIQPTCTLFTVINLRGDVAHLNYTKESCQVSLNGQVRMIQHSTYKFVPIAGNLFYNLN